MIDTSYRHLNLRNEWPGFTLSGLQVRADGALTLGIVPAPDSPGTAYPALATALEGPGGLGVDPDGNVYVVDTANGRVLRIDACDGTASPLAWPCRSGSGPGELNGPRGVIVGPRRSLYIADSGNHRVQVVDLSTLQLRGVWGQPDPFAEPRPGSEPGLLDDPWDLAADAAAWVYVVDHGNNRVQRFDADGRVDASFWEVLSAQPEVPGEPSYVTVTVVDDQERLVVVDRTGPRILLYTTAGVLDVPASQAWTDLPVSTIGAVLFVDGQLYVADPGQGAVLLFDATGHFVGTVAGLPGPVATLALDSAGRVLVHQGGPGTVTALGPGLSYGADGTFLAGPIFVGDAVRWHRCVATSEGLPPGAHVRLATFTSDVPSPAPTWDPATVDPGTAANAALTPSGQWRSAPVDALDILILHEPARYLWIGGAFRSDGTASAVVHQMRLSFDHESYLRHLPALYRAPDPMRGFLARALELFESELGDVERRLDSLTRLFDVDAAPAEDAPASWFEWLTTWLAFRIDESWADQYRRDALRGAFELAGTRGTVEGLRRYVALYAGTPIQIEEPANNASLWSLGASSVLGFTTMLAPAQPGGAVVGTTAVLDHSHLLDERDFGSPLFHDLAHRFCVRVYERDAPTPADLDAVRAVLDEQKPAHTVYDLCPIGPRMRVGVQARLGIDSVVAGPPPPLVFADDVSGAALGAETVLAEARRPSPRVDIARIGTTTLE